MIFLSSPGFLPGTTSISLPATFSLNVFHFLIVSLSLSLFPPPAMKILNTWACTLAKSLSSGKFDCGSILNALTSFLYSSCCKFKLVFPCKFVSSPTDAFIFMPSTFQHACNTCKIECFLLLFSLSLFSCSLEQVSHRSCNRCCCLSPLLLLFTLTHSLFPRHPFTLFDQARETK